MDVRLCSQGPPPLPGSHHLCAASIAALGTGIKSFGLQILLSIATTLQFNLTLLHRYKGHCTIIQHPEM